MALKLWFPLTESLSQQGLTTPATTYSNVTITAGNANSASGVLGRYASFNGSSSHIISSMAINSTNLTVTCWVYSAGNCHIVDMRSGGGTTGYQPIYFNLTSGIQIGGSGNSYQYIPYTFTANKWYHLAVVMSSTDGRLYVNGELVGTNTSAKGYNYNTTLPVYIGSRVTSVNWLNGRLCDVRFYDEALSAKRVKEIYQSLTHHYRFNYIRAFDNKTIPNDAGFGDDLHTVNSGVTLSTDTIRNDKCTVFTNANYACSTYNTGTGWLPQRAITVNIWAKWATWAANPISCTESGGWNFENSSGIQFPVHLYNSSYSLIGYVVAKSGVTVASLANQWNMLTGTFDGRYVKIYINGVLKATQDAGSDGCIIHYNNSAVLVVGGEAAATPTYAFAGSISDVRIYATALTAEDIRKLYEVSASVDNEQTLRVYQATEDSSLTDRSKITKTGKLVASLIDDLSKSKVQLCDDGTVYVKDIKEI